MFGEPRCPLAVPDGAPTRRSHHCRRRLVSLGLMLALGFALLGGGAAARAASPPNGITVTGDGSASLPPDMATVSGSVDTQAGTASDALNQNSQTINAVIAAVEAAGVASSDIRTTQVSVNPIFSQPQTPSNGGPTPPPSIIGFDASNGIRVKTTHLDIVGNLIQTMVTAGLTNFNGVNYGLQDPSKLRAMALQAAIADAQAQAQVAATALGVNLGGVLNFQVQGTSAPPAVSAQRPVALAVASVAAPPPVLPGPLTATTSVTITYALLGP